MNKWSTSLLEEKPSHDLESKILKWFNIPSPYEEKNGVRYLRGSDKLVSSSVKIVATDSGGNKSYFSSHTECSNHLGVPHKGPVAWGRPLRGLKSKGVC